MATTSEMVQRLTTNWEACTRCVLHRARAKVVIGAGPVPARVMLVGEAPGADEDVLGLPFQGRAGQKLRELADLAGVDLETAYITNIVACRPPGNRVPLFDEIDGCRPRLDALFKLVNPSVIVLVGGTAMTSLTGEQGITKKRGKWLKVKCSWKGMASEIPAIATWHPSGLLRTPDAEHEAQLVADLVEAFGRAA